MQIVEKGFNIEDATVTSLSAKNVESAVPPPEGKTNVKHVLIGSESFSFKGVTIDGSTPGGDYAVTIIQ